MMVNTFLEQTFQKRWIGRGGNEIRPFLVGFYKRAPATTVRSIQNSITKTIRNITLQTLIRLQQPFQKRLRLCLKVNERHFTAFLFCACSKTCKENQFNSV